MSGLVIDLKPHEKFLVNGVVLQNGDRRNRVRVRTPSAAVLRMADVLHPVEAITPARHLYYLAQLVVLGITEAEETKAAICERLPELRAAYRHHLADAAAAACEKALDDGKFFAAMRALKRIFSLDSISHSTTGGGI